MFCPYCQGRLSVVQGYRPKSAAPNVAKVIRAECPDCKKRLTGFVYMTVTEPGPYALANLPPLEDVIEAEIVVLAGKHRIVVAGEPVRHPRTRAELDGGGFATEREAETLLVYLRSLIPQELPG